jgi:hypothetical protein
VCSCEVKKLTYPPLMYEMSMQNAQESCCMSLNLLDDCLTRT